MTVGNDHQFCGNAILTLIREVQLLRANVLDATNVDPGLSPEADRIINTSGAFPPPPRINPAAFYPGEAPQDVPS